MCDNVNEKGIYTTVYFAGQFGVIITGLLADKFGRKNVAYLFILLNAAINILIALVTNIPMNDRLFKGLFATLRFLVGCTSNMYSIVVVIGKIIN